VPEVAAPCCLTSVEGIPQNTKRETLRLRLISSLISRFSSRTAISCAWDWPLPASRLTAFPHAASAVLLDILDTLMVVYPGTARWSSVHYSMQAVYMYQIGVHIGVYHSTSKHITYSPLSAGVMCL
jgi:hypothetical protein